jgi:signal peptidase I
MENREPNPFTLEPEQKLDPPSQSKWVLEQLSLFDHTLERPNPLAIESPDGHWPESGTIRIHEDQTSNFWEEAKAFARDLVFSVLVAVLVIVFVVQPVRVEGTSMLPHLHDGERIFVNKFIYRFDTIERGDIVVFWYPKDPSKSFIKRIIGLPGETVTIRDGVVYINNQPLDEPYLDSHYHLRRDDMSAIPGENSSFVPMHYYFVMGDNRDSSNDSRQWGLVPEKYIYGKASFRYWPPGSVGLIR